jgi:hypothetical protein
MPGSSAIPSPHPLKLQAQDSPPSSLLGLGVEDYLGDIEVSSSPKKSEATLAEDVKNRLLDILGHI